MNIEGKGIDIFRGERADAPLILLHIYGGDGKSVLDEVKKLTDRDLTLVSVSGIVWDDDMTPWPIPAIAEGDTPCGGKADEYLRLVTDRIMPAVLEELGTQPVWTGIAGHSLGGLLALYSIYKTDLFSRVASASGSMWYPGLLDYVRDHRMVRKPDSIYFSLGGKESKTDNQFLKPVEDNTRKLEAFYKEQGIRTDFVLNKGGHFKDPNLRTAKGIAWLLEN